MLNDLNCEVTPASSQLAASSHTLNYAHIETLKINPVMNMNISYRASLK